MSDAASEPPSALARWIGYACSLLILGVGGGGLYYLIRTKPEPSGRPAKDPGRLVRYFVAKKAPHRITITAYGTSRAGEEWNAIAEVKGRAVFVDPRFDAGVTLPKDMLLVRLDPIDYQLAIKQYKAQVRVRKQELLELGQKEANLKEMVGLAKRHLALAEKDLEDQKELYRKDAAPKDSIERSETTLVTRKQGLQELLNQIALLPVQRERLKASLELTEAQLEEATRSLKKTEIRLPLNARCVERNIKPDQFANVGERLGRFYAMDTAEVVVPVEPRKMMWLFPKGDGFPGPIDAADPVQWAKHFSKFQFPAEITLGAGRQRLGWKGTTRRVKATLDGRTRTLHVIVEVKDPFKDVQLGVRPPLIPDLYCKVKIQGGTLPGAVVAPRDCLRDNRVYLIRDGNLEIRDVEVFCFEDDNAVISGGLESGDQVVLTDLSPASPGMPLRGEEVANPAEVEKKDAGMAVPKAKPASKEGAQP